jgi:hypothetical protein
MTEMKGFTISVCIFNPFLFTEAEYDLSKLERLQMLDFCTTILVYLESLILFF